MITIHIDFVDGTELSYEEGLIKDDNFTTNCLTFFSQDLTDAENVIVIDKQGRSIDKNELMSNTGFNYTDREMRKEHNIYKMLIANSFTWKQPNWNGVNSNERTPKDAYEVKVDKKYTNEKINNNID